MIEGIQGRGGGYRLNRSPEDCRIGEILRLTEGDLAPVACLECDAKPATEWENAVPIRCGENFISW